MPLRRLIVGALRVNLRRNRVLLGLIVLLAILVASLYWVSRPARVATILLDRVGKGLGLEISASGATEYRLRGTPMLLLRDVVAREPGAATPVVRVSRVYVSLPWSTIRARGSDLTVKRLELDRPQLDLAALQHWLATRPPSVETRIPTLIDGLRITDGSLVGGIDKDSWRIVGLAADLPSLYPDRPLQAHVRGRYLDAPMAAPFDLAIALRNPRVFANGGTTGFGSNGTVSMEHGDWRLPMQLGLSGPLRWHNGILTVTPGRIGLTARYESGESRLPFALGLHGALRFAKSTWTLAPTGLALRGRGGSANDPVPTLDANGVLAMGRQLVLQLDGVIAQWPDAWPALPPPIGQSRSPLPFTLGYVGKTDFRAITHLQLRRDAARFAGRFHLQDVLAWSKAAATGTPLPPITGTFSTPQLTIAGAKLEGVEVEFQDDEPLP